MNRTALAVLVALSCPAAALAHDHDERRYDRPAPPPMMARHDQAGDLLRLLASYDEAAASRMGRRRLPWIEAEIARAFDREIAEARAVQVLSWQGERDRDRYGGRREERFEHAAAPARLRLERLVSLRAEFLRLQGRFGWRAVERKHDLVHELVDVASLQGRYGAPPPPPPPAYAYRDHR
jgi:hypothetical protein